MGAFDGKNKIARAVADRQTDHKLPPSRSLSWEAITTHTALAGTKGVHCGLVHGDEWNELKGNRTKNIAKNQTIKVVGKHKETLVESCYQNIIGPHLVLNNHVRNETRLGTFTLTYGINSTKSTSTGDWHWATYDGQGIYGVSLEFDSTKFEVMGIHGEVVGVHGEVAIVHAEYKTYHNELKTIHVSVVGGVNEDTDAENKLKAVNARIDAVKTDISGVSSQVAGIDNSVSTLKSSVHTLRSETVSMHNFLGLVEIHTGPEVHTGPAIFATIIGPGIL